MKSSFYFLASVLFACIFILSCSEIKRQDEQRKEESEKENVYKIPRALELKEKSNTGQLNSKEAFELGMCYDSGDGVDVDHEEAFRWFAYAIENDETGTEYCNVALTMSDNPSLLPKQQKPWRLLHEKYCQ